MTATDTQAAPVGLIESARAWLAQDPDPVTRDELTALLDQASTTGTAEAEIAVAELHSRFDTRLEFGTAGLRGEIGAGPNRMNRVLVAQAAAGLAAYLLEKAHPGVTPSVVIGYDGRTNSDVFARDSAEIMAGAGVRAILLPRLLPTPVLAFAVRHFDTSAGVMVTASHNPPRDNGYKVYLGGQHEGSQIVAPADAEIAAHILQIATFTNVLDSPRDAEYQVATDEVIDAYISATVAAVPTPKAQLTAVYTALHGVGWETASLVFQKAGFQTPVPVTEQIAPDPAFPTVAFPNPEEPGAMDLAFARAREVGAEIVIANDPDADRLAIAIPSDEPGAEDGWRRLTGDEVGYLLGWEAAERARATGATGALVCTIVSSPALRRVADEYGLEFVETLTGFKWVSRVPGILYGYEEALGYLVNPETVRDKDGISAALGFLAMAAELKSRGLTVADRLTEFTARFGHFASDQISIRVTDLAEIARVMALLRATPPAAVGGVPVARIDDLAKGLGDLDPSNVLRIELADGSRVMVRPSGTEPKLKIYIDASATEGSVAERRSAATARTAALVAGMHALIS